MTRVVQSQPRGSFVRYASVMNATWWITCTDAQKNTDTRRVRFRTGRIDEGRQEERAPGVRMGQRMAEARLHEGQRVRREEVRSAQ